MLNDDHVYTFDLALLAHSRKARLLSQRLTRSEHSSGYVAQGEQFLRC